METTKIEKIRKQRGLSRIELSRQSGVPLRTLEDWEHRRRIARNVYQLKKVADILKVEIEDLLEESVKIKDY